MAKVAQYAAGVGIWSNDLYRWNTTKKDFESTGLIDTLHAKSLQVFSLTFREDQLDYPDQMKSAMEQAFRLITQIGVDGLVADQGGNALMYAYAFQNFNGTSWNNHQVMQEFTNLTKETEKSSI